MRRVEDGFLARRHAQVGVPPAELASLVRRTTGRELATAQRVVAGFDNEVHRVGLDDGRRVYVRIRRFGRRPFAEEAWAMDESRARGVPVPALVALDAVDGVEAMVLDAAAGRALAEVLPSLDERRRPRAFAALGHTLRAIHETPAGGFYERHEDGTWDFDTWDALVASALESRAAERPWLRAAGLDDAEIDAALDAGALYARAFPCREPVLLHGDYLPAHVFVDEALGVTAVIDWGATHGGPREADLGYTWRALGEAPGRALLDGYGRDGVPDAEERVALAGILSGLGYAAHQARIGNADGAAQDVASVRRLLRAR